MQLFKCNIDEHKWKLTNEHYWADVAPKGLEGHRTIEYIGNLTCVCEKCGAEAEMTYRDACKDNELSPGWWGNKKWYDKHRGKTMAQVIEEDHKLDTNE